MSIADRAVSLVFVIVSVACLVTMAVFTVQHMHDECPANTPKLALAHQACIDRLNQEESK
jgi:hypothetical protein